MNNENLKLRIKEVNIKIFFHDIILIVSKFLKWNNNIWKKN